MRKDAAQKESMKKAEFFHSRTKSTELQAPCSTQGKTEKIDEMKTNIHGKW